MGPLYRCGHCAGRLTTSDLVELLKITLWCIPAGFKCCGDVPYGVSQGGQCPMGDLGLPWPIYTENQGGGGCSLQTLFTVVNNYV